MTKLRTDAIVHSNNETFSEKTPLSQQLFQAAGPGLFEELTEEIRGNFIITGEG